MDPGKGRKIPGQISREWGSGSSGEKYFPKEWKALWRQGKGGIYQGGSESPGRNGGDCLPDPAYGTEKRLPFRGFCSGDRGYGSLCSGGQKGF